MQKFVKYYRVSTRSQGQSGLGIEAQQRDVQLYLDNYLNEEHEVIATYTEIDSGSKENRIELSKAIDCCKKHNATLIVSKVDRLSRDLHQLSGFMKDKKLEFRVASLPNADKPMLYLYGMMAEMERDFISKRTKEALASAKARGVKLGGARPGQHKMHQANRDKANANALRVENVIKLNRKNGNSYQANDSNSVLIFI